MKKVMQFEEIPRDCRFIALNKLYKYEKWLASGCGYKFPAFYAWMADLNPAMLDICLWDDHLRLIAC